MKDLMRTRFSLSAGDVLHTKTLRRYWRRHV